MHRVATFVLLATSTARAEVPKEEPCNGMVTTGPLASHYMCQIAMDGVWGQSYPCEIITAQRDAYLRFTKLGLPCKIVGSITGSTKRRFDGSLDCWPEDGGDPDVIGHEAVFETKLDTIAGGFRIDAKIDMVVTRAFGPEDHIPRPTHLEHRATKLSFNICRRPWPAGFHSDLVQLDELE